MVDRERVLAKLEELDQYLAHLRALVPDRFEAYQRFGLPGEPNDLFEAAPPCQTGSGCCPRSATSGLRVPWIVDPDTRVAEAYERAGQAYGLAARASAGDTLTAPPFPDLIVPLPSVWPTSAQGM